MVPNPELQGVDQYSTLPRLHVLDLHHVQSVILADSTESAILIQLFLRTVVKTPTVLFCFVLVWVFFLLHVS